MAIYESILPGIRADEAETYSGFIESAVRSYFLEEFGAKIETEVEVREGRTEADLHQLGRDLQKGRPHVAVVLGLEFAWLMQLDSFQDLDLLVVTHERSGCMIPSHVYVRGDSGIEEFQDLKGKRLAVFHSQSLSDRAFMRWLLQGAGANEFFSEIVHYETAREALFDVAQGGDESPDCVAMSGSVFVHLTLSSGLEGVQRLERTVLVFPSIALVGNPDRVQDVLGPDGWDRFRESLLAAHADRYAKWAMQQFGYERFARPDEAGGGFFSAMRTCAAEIPASSLGELEALFDVPDEARDARQ